MRGMWYGQQGGVKRWLGLGFGMGLGFELAREGLPLVAFVVFLGLLTSPRLTLALLVLPFVGWTLWRTRGLWHESQEARERREARERWGGGRK